MTTATALRYLPAASATAVVGLVVATRPLTAGPRGIALACLVGAWGAAVVFRRPYVRAHATVAAGIAAVTAAGQVYAGLPYGIGCLLFLVACLVSMRQARRAKPLDLPSERIQVRALVILGLAAASVSMALLFGLPRLARHVEQRLNAMFGGDGDEATAFSTTMVLGATRGMLQSDAIVMRIDGDHPEYLRGAVYNRYAPPLWVTGGRGRARTAVPPAPSVDASAARITLVRGTQNGEDMRWFLPPNACDLVASSRKLEVDAFGIARRSPGEDPQVLAYRTGTCTTPPVEPAAPDSDDLDLPSHVRRRLGPIASGWTASAKTPREKLDAIARELRHFEYSLAVPRERGVDPIVDFVTTHRAGHCEMFASAMVLMARAEGIPARVIGGYRVTEVNPLTGRSVVRDRNAHAWVEAWVDGAWRAWDPTPVSETFRRTPSVIDNVEDVLSSAVDVVVRTATKLGTLGIAAILGVVIAVLLVVRWLQNHLRTRRGRKLRAGTNSLPLPCFEALDAELTKAGHPRAEWEPLEALARRVAEIPAPWACDVGHAIEAYAGLRYGGVGEEDEVVRLVERATRSIRTPPR